MGGSDPWRGGGGGVVCGASRGAGDDRSSSWPASISNNNINLPSLDTSTLSSATSSSSLPNSSLPRLSSSSSSNYPSSMPSISSDLANYFATNNSLTVLPTFIAGTFSFYSTLALSTLLQGRMLRISTGTMPPIPTVAGLTSVAAGALVAHGTSVIMTSWRMQKNNNNYFGSTRHVLWAQQQQSSAITPDIDLDQAVARLQSGMQRIRHDLHNLSDALACHPGHAVRIAALALVTFKLLGGRFWSISPSSYTNLGSFARVSHSLPAKMGYATPSQRRIIEAVGRRWGCHTCGSRMLLSRTKDGVKFHADHMPPRSVADRLNSKLWRRILRRKVKQRFYPQCVGCSNVQGGILSKATSNGGVKVLGARNLAASGGGSVAYNHGLRPRMHHVAGGFVAAATVWNADEREVVANGNAKRFCTIQDMIQDTVGGWARKVRDWVDMFR